MAPAYGLKRCHPLQYRTGLQLLSIITFILFFFYFPHPCFAATVSNDLNHEDLNGVGDSVDESLVPIPPQAVVNTFYAYVDSGCVVIEWETVSELNIIGFHIQRLNPKTGKYRSISKKKLPALLVSPGGGIYRYIDRRAKPGREYTYRLIAIGIDDENQVFGPYTILVEDPGLGDPLARDDAFDSVYVEGERFNRKMKRRARAKKTRLDRIQKLKKKQGQTGVYISIKKSGIYRLTSSQIADAMNVPLKNINKWLKQKKLAISYQGQPVAWQPSTNGDGLIFYGEGINSPYTDTNVYRITKGKGVTIKSKDTAESFADPVAESFTKTIYAENDQWPLTSLYNNPYDDFWCWEYLLANYPNLASKDFIIPVPGLVADTAGKLTVEVKGGSTATHKIAVSINDIAVGETTFENEAINRHEFTVPASVLISGDNKVSLAAVKPATGNSIVYVDGFELSYEKAYQAINNQLFFNSEIAAAIRVDGFENNDIKIYDITDPGKIIEIVSAAIDTSDDDSFAIAFETDDTKRQYLVIAGDAVTPLENTQIAGYLSPHLMNTRHAVDYLIITPQLFNKEIQRLADYRRTLGLSVLVVELQDIYDEFNYGIANPEAVRDFLAYAWHNWKKAPRYVVRVGDGSYDYKDNRGTGDTQMPPVLVSTPWGLFASENQLADVDGSEDGIPEMALGLVPTSTVEALAAMIDKIIAYESASGEWKNKVLLTADNPDGGGNFHADSDALAALVPADTYDSQTIYLGPLSITEARQALAEKLNVGAFIMNYFGHANTVALADENLWQLSDVAAMANGGRLPILMGMTCLAGRHELPGIDAISEAMVTKSDGGAIAAWAPTGMALNNLSRILAEEFFRTVFIDNERVLGDAVLTAMGAYKERYPLGNPYMLDIYTLIGDPALVIR